MFPIFLKHMLPEDRENLLNVVIAGKSFRTRKNWNYWLTWMKSKRWFPHMFFPYFLTNMKKISSHHVHHFSTNSDVTHLPIWEIMSCLKLKELLSEYFSLTSCAYCVLDLVSPIELHFSSWYVFLRSGPFSRFLYSSSILFCVLRMQARQSSQSCPACPQHLPCSIPIYAPFSIRGCVGLFTWVIYFTQFQVNEFCVSVLNKLLDSVSRFSTSYKINPTYSTCVNLSLSITIS